MFVFDENYTFSWPVTVEMPEAGAARRAEFMAQFRLVPEDELFAASPAPDGADVGDVIERERLRMAERLIGWEGIETPDGLPLPYSAAACDRLLRQRPIREAVATAYFDAVLRRGIAEKN